MTDTDERALDLFNRALCAVSGFAFFVLAAAPFFH